MFEFIASLIAAVLFYQQHQRIRTLSRQVEAQTAANKVTRDQIAHVQTRIQDLSLRLAATEEPAHRFADSPPAGTQAVASESTGQTPALPADTFPATGEGLSPRVSETQPKDLVGTEALPVLTDPRADAAGATVEPPAPQPQPGLAEWAGRATGVADLASVANVAIEGQAGSAADLLDGLGGHIDPVAVYAGPGFWGRLLHAVTSEGGDSAASPIQRSRAEWEALIGGQLLNRIGALALIIGVGFFLKYAFDNHWFSETALVLMGLSLGAVLLAGADQAAKRDLRMFGQGIAGAGIAILYLSTYASHNLYQLASLPVASAGMLAVTGVAIWQAVRRDSLIVGLLGWAGGFIAPILLGLSSAGDPGFLAYLALLTAGMLALTRYKTEWAVIEPLTFLGAYGSLGAWYASAYRPGLLVPTLITMTVIWGLFLGLDWWRIRRPVLVVSPWQHVFATKNALLYFGGLAGILTTDHRIVLTGMTLVLAAVYGLVYLQAESRHGSATALQARLGLVAVTLLAYGTALELSWPHTIALWAVEASVLITPSGSRHARVIGRTALGLLGVATLGLLIQLHHIRPADYWPLINAQWLAVVAVAGSLVYSHKRISALDDPVATRALPFLEAAWCVVGFAGLCYETFNAVDWFGAPRLWTGEQHDLVLGLGITAILTLYGTALTFSERRLATRISALAGLAPLGLAVALFAWIAVTFKIHAPELQAASYVAVFNPRFLVALLLASALIWIARQWERFPEVGFLQTPAIVRGVEVAWCLVGFLGLSAEVPDLLHSFGLDYAPPVGDIYNFRLTLLFVTVWSLYAAVLTVAERRFKTAVCGLASLVSLGLAILAFSAMDLAYVRIKTFLPIANIRFVVGLLLTGVSGWIAYCWRERETESPQAPTIRVVLQVTVSALVFALAMAETADMFAHWGYVLATSHGTPPAWADPAFVGPLAFVTVCIAHALANLRLAMAWKNKPLAVVALVGGILALWGVIIVGNSFHPIVGFTAVVNVRAATFLLVIGGLEVARRWWLRLPVPEFPQAAEVPTALLVAMAALAFVLVTAENQDHYLKQLYLAGLMDPSLQLGPQALAAFNRGLMMPVGWMVIALGICWLGMRLKQPFLSAVGTGATLVATLVVAVSGYHVPTELPFVPFANGRMAAVVSIVLGALTVRNWWRQAQPDAPWARYVPNGMLGVTTIAALSLVTGEVSDVFAHQLAALQTLPGTAPGDLAHVLELQASSRSAVWLIFAASLMGLGIWRRLQVLRYMAIGLFTAGILKVFLLDLASLSQLRRIISFIGLGVVLLTVSFLYQRFKHVILASDDPQIPQSLASPPNLT